MGFNDFYEESRRPKFRTQQQQAKKPADLNERVTFYKERLYDKIDVAFMQYGLSGLEKIDEAIASAFGESRQPAARPAPRPVQIQRQAPQARPVVEDYEPVATYTEVPEEVLNPVAKLESANNENIDDVCAAILGNINDDDVPTPQLPEANPATQEPEA